MKNEENNQTADDCIPNIFVLFCEVFENIKNDYAEAKSGPKVHKNL